MFFIFFNLPYTCREDRREFLSRSHVFPSVINYITVAVYKKIVQVIRYIVCTKTCSLYLFPYQSNWKLTPPFSRMDVLINIWLKWIPAVPTSRTSCSKTHVVTARFASIYRHEMLKSTSSFFYTLPNIWVLMKYF